MTAEHLAPPDWPDDPQQLELDLAAAEAAYDREREQAHTDLHGPQRVRWQLKTWPTVAPLSEFGRSDARPDNRLRARIQILKAGGLL